MSCAKWHEPAAAVYGILFFGLLLGLIGLAPVFAIVPVFFFLFAFSDPFSYVGFGGIIQRGTPDAIRGRVFAGISGITAISTAFAYAVSGFLVEATGWRFVYVTGGLLTVGCAVGLAIALRAIGFGAGDATSDVASEAAAPPAEAAT